MLDSIISPLDSALPVASTSLFAWAAAALLLGGGAFAVWSLWDTNRPLGLGIGSAALIHLLVLYHFTLSQQGDPDGELVGRPRLFRTEPSSGLRELSWVFEPIQPGDADPFPIHKLEEKNPPEEPVASQKINVEPSVSSAQRPPLPLPDEVIPPHEQANLEPGTNGSEPSVTASGRVGNRFSPVEIGRAHV